MQNRKASYDFCVVGGGMTGLIAALAAARNGAKTALVQDRPVLGGNASSEIRMNICGAQADNQRETGILEEILLENHYRNPQPNYSIWDGILYGKARHQENLDLYLNASVCNLSMNNDRIESVRAWQLTTETWWTIQAQLFADCSGDGILAPLSGAEYRLGREGRKEYDESIAPAEEDGKTMGMSCLIQAREYDRPRPFIPPHWAYTYEKPEDLRGRPIAIRRTNYWWIEVGGDRDSIHETEELRDELLKIGYGVWDYLKNHAPDKNEYTNWGLDWQGFLPGKRESRRYVGDHVMTQKDIEQEGRFDDIVAYGGWSMDDHFPEGFYYPDKGTIHHPAPSPYGIPLRSLYSRNIANLFCAGRCHSASHVAMSSTRVMGTCAVMGQAVGTAAAIAVFSNTTPRGVYEHHISEVREVLQANDAWLPFTHRTVSTLIGKALISGKGAGLENLRNGLDRPDEAGYNGWTGPVAEPLTLTWTEPVKVRALRLVLDSDLNREDSVRAERAPAARKARNMRNFYALNAEDWIMPATLLRELQVEARIGDEETGEWKTTACLTDIHDRLVNIPLELSEKITALRIIPQTTWGDKKARIFSVDVY